jgi:hypothetical protein
MCCEKLRVPTEDQSLKKPLHFSPATGHAWCFMHPFASYVLRTYYKATGWNEDNLYSNLTRSSNGTAIGGRQFVILTVDLQLCSTFRSHGGCIVLYQSRLMHYSRLHTL